MRRVSAFVALLAAGCATMEPKLGRPDPAIPPSWPIGDATLFQRADMVEAGWCVVSPVLDVWKALPPRNFPNYAAGTWGPVAADELIHRDGRSWRRH